MCEIRFAKPDDIAAIHEIWSTVFKSDTADERDRFLQMVDLREECVLACVDGQPVSMAFFLPAVLHTRDCTYSARYLYAASTLPAYQGNGIFANLLNTVLPILKERGIAVCFLNPAEPSLIKYYRRFGFKPSFFSRTVRGVAGTETLPVQSLSADEYITLRQTLLPCEHVVWQPRLLQYAISYATPFRIGNNACALCVKEGHTLRVIELLGVPSETQNAVCGALALEQDCDTFFARVYAATGDCFGMLLSLSGNTLVLNTAPYMGLAFD